MGAKALVSYCSGCLYLLWATKELLGSKMDIFHIVEIVRMAMGEKIPYPRDYINRAWDVIAIITYQLLISIFQSNFFIKRLTYDKIRSTFSPKKYRLLKFIRYLFEIPSLRKFYAKLFRLQMPLMKTR